MKIEITPKLTFYGFKDKSEYQTEVIRIILSDDKYNIFYLGLCEDIESMDKGYLFGNRKYAKVKITRKDINYNWKYIVEFSESEFCIIMWNRLTDKCKYIERKPKINKDGTPRKISVKKNESINRLA